jgi:hypothetical protein
MFHGCGSITDLEPLAALGTKYTSLRSSRRDVANAFTLVTTVRDQTNNNGDPTRR